MRTYDLAFSLGFSCGCSRALRKAGLQFASYPLDWTGSPGIVQSAQMIVSNFDGWLNRDDLELVDVRSGRFGNHIYRNRKTHFGFPHEFSSFLTFDEAYVPTVEKHRRRADRLMQNIRMSKSVFLAYIERPINVRASDAALIEAKRLLDEKFNGVSFELAYFFQDEVDGVVQEREIAPGIMVFKANYRQFLNGEVWHEINYGVISDWMKSNIAVIDTRSESEKKGYENTSRNAKKKRFDGERNPLKRKFNEWQYKLYRHLDDSLKAKGILPQERALWF